MRQIKNFESNKKPNLKYGNGIFTSSFKAFNANSHSADSKPTLKMRFKIQVFKIG
jgi:hypothetical protein